VIRITFGGGDATVPAQALVAKKITPSKRHFKNIDYEKFNIGALTSAALRILLPADATDGSGNAFEFWVSP
jgi:hypothetical protein